MLKGGIFPIHLELVKQIKIWGMTAEYKCTNKGYAGSTCSETFLGKHQLKCLRLTKGFKAVEVNGDSYWLRSRKEKHLMAVHTPSCTLK